MISIESGQALASLGERLRALRIERKDRQSDDPFIRLDNLIGNTDDHLKNFSLLHGEDGFFFSRL